MISTARQEILRGNSVFDLPYIRSLMMSVALLGQDGSGDKKTYFSRLFVFRRSFLVSSVL